ncbi:MAG: hypothetical protein E7353_10040 [Clostridiales bacterium]|nr:hypothetical protein [Clostridiales bacterium]
MQAFFVAINPNLSYKLCMKVMKFGGTSMATAQSIKAVANIIKKTEECVIVVSAPGKRFDGDEKITDLLYDCYKTYLELGRCDVRFKEVIRRFEELSLALGVNSLGPLLTDIKNEINGGKSIGYVVSRGEFLIAKLLAEYAGVEFVDAIGLIKFDGSGKIDYETTRSRVNKRLRGLGVCIVPGFYGVLPNGIIRTFSRGGSDITGSLIAASLDAEVYENWTDVDGIYFANPLLSKSNKIISKLSYEEMRLLSLMGAYVLHHDSIAPAVQASIPVKIKNTFNPCSDGSVISNIGANETVCGIAIKENLCLWEYGDSEFIRDYLASRQFVMPLPSGQRQFVITEMANAEEIDEIISTKSGVSAKKISVITAVGENIKKSACLVTKRILDCVSDLEFLVYDGALGLYVGVNPDNAVELYQKICASLEFN